MRTTLWLVRHGQAGQHPEAYDQLSDLGQLQSQRLAAHWLAHEQHFAACCSGQLVRQQRTLATIREQFATAGRPLTEPSEWPELDEYRFDALVRGLVEVDPSEPALQALLQSPTDRRHWIPALRAALLAWGEGRLDAHVPEPYPQFRQRIERLAERLREQARATEGPILAVSSGGVISAFIQQSLGAPAAAAVDLNLALRNSAVVTFGLDSAGRWHLQSFNALPHLNAPADRNLWTLI